MKTTMFLLLSVLFFGACSSTTSPYTITLKLTPIGDSDYFNKNINEEIGVRIKQTRKINVSEWKKVKILYNQYEDEIKLGNPSNDKNITIPKGESVLVKDVIEYLVFENERDFFNSLAQKVTKLNYPLSIYSYSETCNENEKRCQKTEDGSNKKIYFNHVYGIKLSKKENTNSITKEIGVR